MWVCLDQPHMLHVTCSHLKFPMKVMSISGHLGFLICFLINQNGFAWKISCYYICHAKRRPSWISSFFHQLTWGKILNTGSHGPISNSHEIHVYHVYYVSTYLWYIVKGDLSISWHSIVKGDLSISWHSTVKDDLSIAWHSTVKGDLSIALHAAVKGDFSIVWHSTVKGNLFIAWHSTVKGDLSIPWHLPSRWCVV